jgi:hypothetical protein
MSSTPSSLDLPFQRLRDLRLAILHLHKALLDSERIVYEQFHGRIKSNVEFFQLVTEHEWFDWLRPISQLIVKIDEATSAKEPMTIAEANQLIEAVRSLLKPAQEGTTLEKQLYRAIQRDPNVAMLQVKVTGLANTPDE